MGNGCNRIDPACVRQMNDIHEAIAPICLLSTAMCESTVGKCCTFEWHFPSSKHLWDEKLWSHVECYSCWIPLYNHNMLFSSFWNGHRPFLRWCYCQHVKSYSLKIADAITNIFTYSHTQRGLHIFFHFIIITVALLFCIQTDCFHITSNASRLCGLSILIRAGGGHSSNNFNWANQATTSTSFFSIVEFFIISTLTHSLTHSFGCNRGSIDFMLKATILFSNTTFELQFVRCPSITLFESKTLMQRNIMFPFLTTVFSSSYSVHWNCGWCSLGAWWIVYFNHFIG